MILITTVKKYFLLLLFLVIFNGRTTFWRYAFDLVDIYDWCYLVFLMLYSYLRRMRHFLISVSVSKVNYRGRVEIVIIIAIKTPWLYYSGTSHGL